MIDNDSVIKKTYTLTIKEDPNASWLVATSEELPEVMVHGANMKQLRERATNIIKRTLENQGLIIENIELAPPPPKIPTHFVVKSRNIAKTLTVVATCEEAA